MPRGSITRRHSIRRAITLIEVLISIFILAVGILSIAALLPLGQSEANRAEIRERAAQIGQNAFNTFRTRGYSNMQWWINAAGTTSVVGTGNPPVQPVFNQPLIFDPLLAAGSFAYNIPATSPATGPVLFPRYTFKQTPTTSGGTKLSVAQAEGIFVSRDDKLLEDRNTPEAPARLLMEPKPVTTNSRKVYEGRFSWMAMLTPAYPGLTAPNVPANTPYVDMPCELSIIVFDRRPVQTAATLYDVDTVADQSIPRERSMEIVFNGGGIGGGEAQLRNPSNTYHLLVTPGEYILVMTQQAPLRARWYKVLSADAYQPSATSREITLAGPDWTFPGVARAIIFDGAVGVYTKSIRLEGPSPWN